MSMMTGNRISGLLIVLAGSGVACASPATLSFEPVLYPAPPDTARIQFLTAINSSRDLGENPSLWQQLVGTEQEDARGIAKPYGIALQNGKIYVCDTFINGLDIIDLENNTLDFFQPGDAGRLMKPINCFVDDEGTRYVVDTQRHEVVVFDSSGVYNGALSNGDSKPGDVFVSDDRIWVTDISHARVRVYDRTSRELLFAFPDAESGTPEALVAPANIYVTPRAVYVSDVLGGKVNVYDHNGAYLRTVGTYGGGFGQFARPKGVAVDREENLFVVDAAFQNVQMFDTNGDLLMFFGGPGADPGDMTLPAKVIIDYDNLDYFEQYVRSDLDLRYLILVTNQYGSQKVAVYGFVGPPPRADIVTPANQR